MVALRDQAHALDAGLAEIRRQFDVPAGFPPEVLAAAAESARRPLDHPRDDLTDVGFVTLDPATSSDLDQAFAIDGAAAPGGDVVLRYAIADIGAFVRHDDVVDREAWSRGMTLYLPDGNAGLYPPVLAQGAASLLPDGPRPAIVLTVAIAADGTSSLKQARRAWVRSRAKLAYDTARPGDLPDGLDELWRRVSAAEAARGAGRVDVPEQVVEAVGHHYELRLRPRLDAEERNAAMSLATNFAVADALLAAGTGLFRTMPEPGERALQRLRHTAAALDIAWPAGVQLAELVRTLDASRAGHAAFMTAIRRAGGGAGYEPFRPGEVPWHAAVAGTYAHATAPLRRLADRYVLEAALAVGAGREVPAEVSAAFEPVAGVMQRAGARAGQIERAVVDLAEAVTLRGLEGRTFAAAVTDVDERGVRIQLADRAVVARVDARGVRPGDMVRVRLVESDPPTRAVVFERVA